MKCKETTSWKDNVGYTNYSVCNKDAKFKVSFIEGTGKPTEKNVCGIHCNSIKKWDKRLREKTSFNPNLVIEELKTV
jgi:hypothetical protein